MNKQQLANKIWESANRMRSKIEANEYKDYILGFVFYKFLSEQQTRFLKDNEFSDADIATLHEGDTEAVEYVQNNLGYFIAGPHLFASWLARGREFNIADVRDALSAFSRLVTQKKVFDGIFNTLETGLSKLGDSAASQTRSVSDLLQLIRDIPMHGRQDYDVLGFIYEYLIGMFAANAGKKAGEFYTPHEVSVLMSEIIAAHLKGRDTIQIYDPTSGSGSLLINIGQAAAKHLHGQDKIQYYAQELKQNTYNLTRMNLVMRGIKAHNIFTRNADTLEDDWPWFDDNDPAGTYNPLYVDAVVSNPPYSQAWDPEHKESDPRYARFGLAPKTKADFAFLLHDLYHLKPDGIMTIVLPHGVLFRGGEEEKIRTQLIEHNHIDAIIGLPANIFFGTGIPTVVIVLRQKRERSDVLFIDASRGYLKDGKNNRLLASHIRRIADTVAARQDVPRYARCVSRQDIRAQGYNLNIPRYVDSAEPAQSRDIHATLFGGIPHAEIDTLAHYWRAFPRLKASLLTSAPGAPSARLAVPAPELARHIGAHPDVQAFAGQFAQRFENFAAHWQAALLDGDMQTIGIPQQKEALSQDLFQRLAGIALIDPYAAYQWLDDQWQTIATDLEIIQTEGPAALTQVNPRIVSKKRNGQDVQVQDGWAGHILPFELVQSHHFQAQLATLQTRSARLAAIEAELQNLLDELGEDEKSSPAINDAGDAFNPKTLPEALQSAEGDFRQTLQRAQNLLKEEKQLKKTLKDEAQHLHLATKARLENLSAPQALALLQHKWITPLQARLQQLPQQVIDDLSQRITALADKYAHTLQDTSAQLAQSQQQLAAMLGQLTGSAADMQAIAAWQALLQGGKA